MPRGPSSKVTNSFIQEEITRVTNILQRDWSDWRLNLANKFLSLSPEGFDSDTFLFFSTQLPKELRGPNYTNLNQIELGKIFVKYLRTTNSYLNALPCQRCLTPEEVRAFQIVMQTYRWMGTESSILRQMVSGITYWSNVKEQKENTSIGIVNMSLSDAKEAQIVNQVYQEVGNKFFPLVDHFNRTLERRWRTRGRREYSILTDLGINLKHQGADKLDAYNAFSEVVTGLESNLENMKNIILSNWIPSFITPDMLKILDRKSTEVATSTSLQTFNPLQID